MAFDIKQAQENAAKRRAGDLSAGLTFASDAAKKRWEALRQTGERAPTYGGGSQTTTPTVSTTTPSLAEQLKALQDKQKGYIGEIGKAQQSLGNVRQSAYEKIFGEGSAIQEFFNPAIAAAEQGITDVTEFIRKLPDDVLDESLGSGMTEAQARRITGKRSGELSDALAEYTSSYERLTAGRATAMQMGELEYNAMVADAQDQINATVQELYASQLLTEGEIAEVKGLLEANLSNEVQLKTGVDGILQEARNLIYEAGITPSAAFDKVIKDAYAMAAEGKNLGEIQAGVFGAIEQNPAIRSYIATRSALSLGGGSGGGGSSLPSTGAEWDPYVYQVLDDQGNINYETLDALSSDIRDGVVYRLGQLGLMPTSPAPAEQAAPIFNPGSPGATVVQGVTSPFNAQNKGTPGWIASSFWNWLTGKNKTK